MKNYDKNKESSFLQYLDANNLYGWAKIDEKFIKNYDEDSVKGYIFEVDVKYPRRLHDLHSDLPFLPKRMKIDKCKKLVCNYVIRKNTS